MIRCLVFSSKLRVLGITQNLNEHIRLGEMIPTQLVSLKTEFV